MSKEVIERYKCDICECALSWETGVRVPVEFNGKRIDVCFDDLGQKSMIGLDVCSKCKIKIMNEAVAKIQEGLGK